MNNPCLKEGKKAKKRKTNLEKDFAHAACPLKGFDNCAHSVNRMENETSNVKDMLHLSNEEKNPVNIENHGKKGDVDQCSTSLQEINHLCGDVKCNKVARNDGSFKDETLKCIHDHKLVTAMLMQATWLSLW